MSALALSACLVTQEATYETPEHTPRLAKLSPLARTFRVPFGRTDPNCDIDAIAFQAAIADLDVGQDLYYRLYLNGERVDTPRATGRILPGASRADSRTMEVSCLPKSAINGIPVSCSVVTLVVTSDYEKAQAERIDPFSLSADTAYLEWQVLKGSDVNPEIETSACDELDPPDAGVLAEGGALIDGQIAGPL